MELNPGLSVFWASANSLAEQYGFGELSTYVSGSRFRTQLNIHAKPKIVSNRDVGQRSIQLEVMEIEVQWVSPNLFKQGLGLLSEVSELINSRLASRSTPKIHHVVQRSFFH